MKLNLLVAVHAFLFTIIYSAPTVAATTWTDWTNITVGDPGAASGNIGSIAVDYSGEVLNGATVINGTATIWNPDSTFIGGVVDTSPDSVGDFIGINGSPNVGTISFSTPVIDPVIAIWSLGNTSEPASFTFSETPILQVGGPNIDFGGSSIIVSGNVVSGEEGNGVILFDGEFSSITWTSTNEHFYAFTVGSAAVPIPATVWLFTSGLLGLIGMSRRSSKTV